MDYYDWKASYTRNAATPRVYKVWIDRFLTFVDKDASEVTLADISAFRESLRGAYAPANIQFGMCILHDFIKFQMAHGLDFPIALFKVKKERANSHYVISEKEYVRLVSSVNPNSITGLRNILMIRILWETGVRVGELVGMRRGNLEKRGCQIYNEKNTFRRNVYWSQDTETLLRFYMSLTPGERIFEVTSRQIERALKGEVNRAGLSNKICPHSFRHAFVHRQILKGTSEPVVANMVGHVSTNTIMTYSKLSSNELAAAWGVRPKLRSQGQPFAALRS